MTKQAEYGTRITSEEVRLLAVLLTEKFVTAYVAAADPTQGVGQPSGWEHLWTNSLPTEVVQVLELVSLVDIWRVVVVQLARTGLEGYDLVVGEVIAYLRHIILGSGKFTIVTRTEDTYLEEKE